MIIKFLAWLAVIWIGLWLLSQLLSWLPLIVFVIGGAIALCCVYALLPENFRLPGVEQWLNPNWKTIPVAPSTNPSSSISTFSPESSLPSTTPTPQTPIQPLPPQPPLDFSRAIARTGGKLPDRETLAAKLREKVIGQEIAVDTLVRVVLGKLAAQKNPKPLVILLPGPTGTGRPR